MTAIELRSKLIKIINSADINYLKKMDLFVNNSDEYELSEAHKQILMNMSLILVF